MLPFNIVELLAAFPRDTKVLITDIAVGDIFDGKIDVLYDDNELMKLNPDTFKMTNLDIIFNKLIIKGFHDNKDAY